MADYIEWPRGYIDPTDWDRGYNPFVTNEAYLSLSGRLGPGLGASRGDWRPVFKDIPITRKNWQSWINIEGQVSGRLLPIAVPYYHRGFYPKDGDIDTETTFSDTATFSDGSTFVTSGTHVVVASAADAGVTSISVTKINCGTILPGHVFSISLHQYQVQSVSSQDDTSATLTITPELRANIFPSDEVDFVFPAVMCRMIKPMGMSASWKPGQYTTHTIEFIEDTTP